MWDLIKHGVFVDMIKWNRGCPRLGRVSLNLLTHTSRTDSHRRAEAVLDQITEKKVLRRRSHLGSWF